MSVNDIAKLIKVHNKMVKIADFLLPGIDHEGTVFGLYTDISEVIMNNLGDKYSEIIKTDDGVDKVLEIINKYDIPYTDRAMELMQ